MPAIVTALTEGNIITITSTETNGGITTTSKVVRTKKQCYSNITGTNAAPAFSIVDHKGVTIFTKTFNGDTQDDVTHSINAKVTFANIWAEFNTWNGGVGVAALQPEKVYIAQLTQSGTNTPPTYSVVKNTLGRPLVFASSATNGVYTQALGTGASAIYDKTKASYACGGGIAATTSIQVAMNGDTLTITSATSGTGTNGLLSATPVSIRVQH